MKLIQILLPLQDDEGRTFPSEQYDRLAQELTERFGGVTNFARSPAEGRWKQSGSTKYEDMVVMEVMTETVDHEWWSDMRQRLMREFRQDEVVIRCQPIERL
jgi:hypothetical protein